MTLLIGCSGSSFGLCARGNSGGSRAHPAWVLPKGGSGTSTTLTNYSFSFASCTLTSFFVLFNLAAKLLSRWSSFIVLTPSFTTFFSLSSTFTLSYSTFPASSRDTCRHGIPENVPLYIAVKCLFWQAWFCYQVFLCSWARSCINCNKWRKRSWVASFLLTVPVLTVITKFSAKLAASPKRLLCTLP